MCARKLPHASALNWLSLACISGFITSAAFGTYVEWAINAVMTSLAENPDFTFITPETVTVFEFPTYPLTLQAVLFIPAIYIIRKFENMDAPLFD